MVYRNWKPENEMYTAITALLTEVLEFIHSKSNNNKSKASFCASNRVALLGLVILVLDFRICFKRDFHSISLKNTKVNLLRLYSSFHNTKSIKNYFPKSYSAGTRDADISCAKRNNRFLTIVSSFQVIHTVLCLQWTLVSSK